MRSPSSEAALRYLTLTEPAPQAGALAAAMQRMADAPPGTDVLLADLAIGRVDRARARIQEPHPDLLVAARYAAWTGDLHALAAAWQPLRAAALALLGADADADPGTDRGRRRARVCAELERTATDLGDVRLAAELHRCARAADTAPRLSDVTAGTDADAALILRVVHGMLGAEPDAARNRLRLRPRLDAATPRLRLQNLAFAGGSLRLELTRDADTLTCRVDQETGAIPCTLLLEPYLDAPLAAAAVDGAPARLDTRELPDGTITAVQLVLDHERTVELRLGPQSKEPPT